MCCIGAKQAFPLPATEQSCPLALPGLHHWCQGRTATGEGSVATAMAATCHPVLLATHAAAAAERYAGVTALVWYPARRSQVQASASGTHAEYLSAGSFEAHALALSMFKPIHSCRTTAALCCQYEPVSPTRPPLTSVLHIYVGLCNKPECQQISDR